LGEHFLLERRTGTPDSFRQTREGNFQLLGRGTRLALQPVGQAIQRARQAILELLLGEANRLRQFKTWELQAILE